MEAKTKKYLVAGIIGAVTITGALLYLQYKKMMNYVLKFRSIKGKKFSANAIDFDLFLNFTNNADIGFTIKSQLYNVYVNDVFITKIENSSPLVIKPKDTSILGINIALNPKDIMNKLGTKALGLLITPDKFMIKLDMKLRVQLYIFTVNIPYTYQTTLKQIMTAKDTA